jgi:hypothetical protein
MVQRFVVEVAAEEEPIMVSILLEPHHLLQGVLD